MIRAYDLGGDPRGLVPAPLSAEWVAREGELSTLKVSYSELAPRSAVLDGVVEVAYLVPDAAGTGWHEPPNARLIVADDKWERLRDGARVHSYDFVSLAAEFAHHQLQGEGENRTFSAVTAGAIIKTFVDEVKAAGGLSWLTLGFTATTDSRGLAWPHYLENGSTTGQQVHTIEVPHRTKDLLTLLQELPWVQWWLQGRTLHVAPWKPGTVVPVHLPDSLMTESPESIGHGNVYSHIRVIGDEGAHWLFPVTGVNPAYGRRVKVIQARGVTTQGAASLLAEAEFPAARDQAESFTRQWAVTDGTPWIPGRDLALGDIVTADTKDGRRIPQKIAGMSVKEDKSGRSAFVTLGMVRDGLLLKMAKAARSTAGGVGTVIGGPPLPGPRWPGVPTGLVAESATWTLPGGQYRGLITATWSAVTTDNGGQSSLQIDGYSLQGRRTVGQFAVDWFQLGRTDQLSLQVSHHLMEVGDTWEVRVAAIHQGGTEAGFTGQFSAPVAVQIGPDTNPPPTPSVPLVTSANGILSIRWDGLTATGGAMPVDLDYINVHLTGIATPFRMDRIGRVLPLRSGEGEPLAVGMAYEARLGAVDVAGNESTPLSQPAASVTVKSVLDGTDWAEQMAKVTTYGENLYPDNLYRDAARNALRATPAPGWTIANGTIKPASGDASYLWLTPTGHVTGANVSAAQYVLGRSYVVSATVDAGPAAQVRLVTRDANGVIANIGAGAVVAAGGQLAFERVWVCDSTSKQLGIWMTGAPTLRTITAQQRVRSAAIEGNAVRAEHVFADEGFMRKITAALGQFDGIITGWLKAAMIDVDALNFKTATGMTLVTPNIRTHAEANRGWKVSTGSEQVYDTAGNITFSRSWETGAISLTGDIRTSGEYPRVEIARDLWGPSADFAGIRWQLGPGWAQHPELRTNAAAFAGDLAGSIYLEGANKDALTMRPLLALRSGRNVNGSDQFWPTAELVLAKGTARGRIRLRDEGQDKTSILAHADFVELRSMTGQQIDFPMAGTTADIRVATTTGGIRLEVGNGFLVFQGLGTTTGGSDLAIETGSRVVYRSSLRKDKLAPAPIPALYELLEVVPQTWVDRNRRAADARYGVRYAGFIAEDVQAVSQAHGGSLDPLLMHRDGQLSGIAYHAWPAYQQAILRDIESRVTALEARRQTA